MSLKEAIAERDQRTLLDQVMRWRKIERAALDLMIHGRACSDTECMVRAVDVHALEELFNPRARYGEIRCAVQIPGGQCLLPHEHYGGHCA